MSTWRQHLIRINSASKEKKAATAVKTSQISQTRPRLKIKHDGHKRHAFLVRLAGLLPKPYHPFQLPSSWRYWRYAIGS